MIDAAFFHTEIKNQQLYFLNTNPPSQNIVVIPQAHVNGGELNVLSRPTANLNVNFNLGVANARIDKFPNDPNAIGKRAPLAPSYTAFLSADYTVHLTETTNLVAYAGFTQRGPVYWDADNTLKTPSKQLLDLRLTYNFGRYAITAYGKNVLDEQYPVQVQINAFAPGVDGRSISQPASYGVELRAQF